MMTNCRFDMEIFFSGSVRGIVRSCKYEGPRPQPFTDISALSVPDITRKIGVQDLFFQRAEAFV